MSKLSVETLAHMLNDAWEKRVPIPPLSESIGLASVEEAYAVQTRWTELRLAHGEKIMGRKIGLTSPAIQQQFKVNEPDYGALWGSRYYKVQGGQVEVAIDTFLQPRLEGEIAFLLGQGLRGPGVTWDQVLAATEALAPAVEIIDSRIENWRIKLVDTVADNASYGGFAVGPWSRQLLEADLRLLGMIIQQNGEAAAEGIGAAALGHPAKSVAWLINKLVGFGVGLEPGDIVISGALARALPAVAGDTFILEMSGQPPLTVKFT
ncbi:MAG: fumarylacetoacetate hydrolase family protein [Anaerolineae bacterium]|nr:fumarylacetoacetate hydrolase family protein [Anaerolineae bacterium]